jgi:HEAT repeat protein
MKCEDVESSMIDYLDNTLEKSRRDEVEKHLETCERCLDELKDFQQILQTVDSTEMEQPDETLRINFYHMLHGEMNKQVMKNQEQPILPISVRRSSPWIKIAAAIALLLAGTFIGLTLHFVLNRHQEGEQVASLKTEVQSMKELMMLDMLKQESPSQRIQAVNYTDDIQAPDIKVLNALTETLNNDKNINVRMAAAYSLAKYADRQSVRDSMVASLSRQTEPIIQVVLMNILVEKKESSAIKPIQKIMSDEKSIKEVKDVAKKGLNILL